MNRWWEYNNIAEAINKNAKALDDVAEQLANVSTSLDDIKMEAMSEVATEISGIAESLSKMDSINVDLGGGIEVSKHD
jgi:uncharacterized protein YoxC